MKNKSKIIVALVAGATLIGGILVFPKTEIPTELEAKVEEEHLQPAIAHFDSSEEFEAYLELANEELKKNHVVGKIKKPEDIVLNVNKRLKAKTDVGDDKILKDGLLNKFIK